MTRWNRFFEKQMEDHKLRDLVEEDLKVLRDDTKIVSQRKQSER